MTEPPIEPPATQQTHFEGSPPEYQEITLPQEIIAVLEAGGSVVPLPVDLFPLTEELTAFAASVSFDLAPYDPGRLVAFTSDEGYTYIAAPIQAEFFRNNFEENFEQGELVGTVYDQEGAFGGRPDNYEVWFFDDSVTLRSTQEEVLLTTEAGQFFWTQQEIYKDIPLAIFIKASCYLCWSLDSRSGCLICK